VVGRLSVQTHGARPKYQGAGRRWANASVAEDRLVIARHSRGVGRTCFHSRARHGLRRQHPHADPFLLDEASRFQPGRTSAGGDPQDRRVGSLSLVAKRVAIDVGAPHRLVGADANVGRRTGGWWTFGLECCELPSVAAPTRGVVLLEPKLGPLLGDKDTMREPHPSTAAQRPTEAELLRLAQDVTA